MDFLYAYTGRVWDEDAELYYYRARWYDPAIGRFISEDPIGFASGDTNLYRYVKNSPTNGTDPSGLRSPWLAGTKAFLSSIGKNLYHGVRNLVTGQAGRALGQRAVAITENSGDGQFNGGFNDWARFGTRGLAGELSGANALGEAIGGADLATEERLNGLQRWQRGFAGFGQMTGTAAGGLAGASRLAPGSVTFASKPLRFPGFRSRSNVCVTPTTAPTGANVRPRGTAPEFPGGRVSESGFLRSAEEYLGPGYGEVSHGRFVSADGMRQVRFGAHETRGPRLHGHFEAFDRPYGQGGRIIENTSVDIFPD